MCFCDRFGNLKLIFIVNNGLRRILAAAGECDFSRHTAYSHEPRDTSNGTCSNPIVPGQTILDNIKPSHTSLCHCEEFLATESQMGKMGNGSKLGGFKMPGSNSK